jgi:hypothetical protein
LKKLLALLFQSPESGEAIATPPFGKSHKTSMKASHFGRAKKHITKLAIPLVILKSEKLFLL